jgi:hypothetical protein
MAMRLRRLRHIPQQIDLAVQSHDEAVDTLPPEDRMELRAMDRELADRPVEIDVGNPSAALILAQKVVVAAFHQGLKETGYVEGENVTIEYRWAEGRYDRLPALAADLVGRKVDVIVAGSTTSAGTATAPPISRRKSI